MSKNENYLLHFNILEIARIENISAERKLEMIVNLVATFKR